MTESQRDSGTPQIKLTHIAYIGGVTDEVVFFYTYEYGLYRLSESKFNGSAFTVIVSGALVGFIGLDIQKYLNESAKWSSCEVSRSSGLVLLY